MKSSTTPYHMSGLEIAVIGMSGRFPGAKNVDEFWCNIRDGVESISFFSDQELLTSGIDPLLLKHPNYIKAHGALEDIDLFDAAFFGFSAREAEIIDPQQRLFLECAWEALENAGYDPQDYKGIIGVYAGAGMNSYYLNLYMRGDFTDPMGKFLVMIGNEKDYLTTRVSYKLNLEGPSVVVQTACSTSLVAVHLACQSLLSGECDMALAGGVSVKVPQKSGYLFQEGGIDSPDGHCRAFDAKAQGTVFGSGLGIVVLKRLADALSDRDHVYAIIRGSAINNDGSFKVGYTAPSLSGQVNAIRAALLMADVDPETITYVETHGTGTPLGDPIEVAALTEAFRSTTDRNGFCAIGSVKTNIGHLDAAAGVAGLIKTILSLKHKQLPPTLHLEQLNPKIDFGKNPFYVNDKLRNWEAPSPLRAGVSSFGIGGTNAHVILEEAPVAEPSEKSNRPWQLLMLSAKTGSALEIATSNLVKHLKQHNKVNLADTCYTLQLGRRVFTHRRMLVCQGLTDALTALEKQETSPRGFTRSQEATDLPVVFMFPGQGAQYLNMGVELYQIEPEFRKELDLCAELLIAHIGLDLRDILYPNGNWSSVATGQLNQTAITQPTLFMVEYALAKLWMSWGVRPKAMIGHSLGEYVAACLSGVFSLKDALTLVAARGRLMQELTGGAMLAVGLSEQEIRPILINQQLSLAAVNSASQCVISGPVDAVDSLQSQLIERGIIFRRLDLPYAFHSEMMEPAFFPFIEQLSRVSFQPPKIPYISNVTGTWITAEEATDPSYWWRHLRQTVHFAKGIQELTRDQAYLLLEVGPGRTLGALARQCLDQGAETNVVASIRHSGERCSDMEFLLKSLGRLWLADVHIDWAGFYAHERRNRVALPTYPFESRRYWIEPPKKQTSRSLTSQGPFLSDAEQHHHSLDLSHPRPDLKIIYVAPRNGIERQIANIWQEVFGIHQVGIHDNFFELGGDSLLAVRMMSKIREQFEKELPVAKLFEHATIEHLATILSQ